MARKKNNNEQGVSMDSLMDALTNVVAVLIVILILLQTDVQQAVEKLLNDLKPASQEEIQAAQKQKQQLLDQVKKQEDLLKAPEPTPQELGKMDADLSLLEKSIQMKQSALLELDLLQKKIELHKKEESEERKKTDAILAEINRIKALLDQTPIPKAPQPTVVSIPNSRDIPESAVLFYVYTHKDQIHLVDPTQAKKIVMGEFSSNERNLFRELRKIPKKADVRVYDQEKIVKFFAAKNLKLRNQALSVPYNKPWTKLFVRINFDPSKGDATLADCELPQGRFHNVCNYIKQTPRCVVIFKVHPNSFATYIKAREIADKLNIPCGWEVDNNNVYDQGLDFEVNRLEQPPPPKPATTPPVAAPKRKLD
jgi:hypothetical protein